MGCVCQDPIKRLELVDTIMTIFIVPKRQVREKPQMAEGGTV